MSVEVLDRGGRIRRAVSIATLRPRADDSGLAADVHCRMNGFDLAGTGTSRVRRAKIRFKGFP